MLEPKIGNIATMHGYGLAVQLVTASWLAHSLYIEVAQHAGHGLNVKDASTLAPPPEHGMIQITIWCFVI